MPFHQKFASVFCFVGVLFLSPISAQYESVLKDQGVCNRDYGISLGMSFNQDDFQFLFNFEHDISKVYFLSMRESFSFRPYRRSTLIPVRDHYSVQYQEWRGSLDIGLRQKVYVGNHFAFLLDGGVLYSFGDFSGSTKGENLFSPWFGAGVGLYGNGFRAITLSYQYFPQPHLSSHRISLSFGLPFGDHWSRG